MNYIYDIVLNFNPCYYDFFEWKKNDNIINVRKIPLFKVCKEDYYSLKYNKIKVDIEFVKKINSLTSTYSRTKYDNTCLVSDGNRAMGLMFGKDGILLKRSSMLLDEEEEVIEEARIIDISTFNYQKNKKVKVNNKLRIEKEKIDCIIKFVNNTDDYKLLKYIYYDYYEKENNDIGVIKKEILKEINDNWTNNKNKLYDLIVLMNKIKN